MARPTRPTRSATNQIEPIGSPDRSANQDASGGDQSEPSLSYFRYVRIGEVEVRVQYRGVVDLTDARIKMKALVYNGRLWTWAKVRGSTVLYEKSLNHVCLVVIEGGK